MPFDKIEDLVNRNRAHEVFVVAIDKIKAGGQLGFLPLNSADRSRLAVMSNEILPEDPLGLQRLCLLAAITLCDETGGKIANETEEISKLVGYFMQWPSEAIEELGEQLLDYNGISSGAVESAEKN